MIQHHLSRHIAHHVTSYIASHHITKHITSKHATLHHNTSHPYQITSRYVMSCHVIYHNLQASTTNNLEEKWPKHHPRMEFLWLIPDAFYGRFLKIINVNRDLHQDVYTCEAENSQNFGNPLVYTINLNVKGKLRQPRSQGLENKVEITAIQVARICLHEANGLQLIHTLFDK